MKERSGVVLVLIRCALALILLFSGVLKLVTMPSESATKVSSALLQQWTASRLFMVPLGLVEMTVGCGLLFSGMRIWRASAAVLCAALMTYAFVLDLSGVDLSDCGCFGIAAVGRESHLILLVGMGMMALALAWPERRQQGA